MEEKIIEITEAQLPQQATERLQIDIVEKAMSNNGNDVLHVVSYSSREEPAKEYFGKEALAIVQEYGTLEQFEMAKTISDDCEESFTLKRLNLSEQQLRDLKVYRKHTIDTCHAGHKSSDGGEYGMWETHIIFHSIEGRYFLLKKFGTTCDGFASCEYCGNFQQEGNSHCIGNDTEIKIEGVWVAPSMLVEIPSKVIPLIEGGITEKNGTGHEYSCSEQGGCKVCYPYTR